MNILFICNEYPPGKTGGIGSGTRALAKAMVKTGHKIFIAGLYPPGYGQRDYEEADGIKIWRKRLSLDFGIIGNNYSTLDAIILKFLSLTRIVRMDVLHSLLSFNSFLASIIEKFDIDIIEWPDFNEYFSYLPADFSWPTLSIPLVIKFHGTSSYINKQMGAMTNQKLYHVEKTHIERADALISVSKKTAEDYINFYKIQREITTLYNSIDIPPLGYQLQELPETIVYVGALTESKGIYSLLRSWNLVVAKRPKALLRIFGKGKHDPLLNLIDPEVKPSVVFEGFVTHDEIYKAMSTAAAAIFPSYTECFAIAPLEAMALGCPVIYTERSSGPELIAKDINGLLVDPDNQKEMAHAMLLLLQNGELREKFSVRGRATVEQRFDIRQSTNDHINFYSRVMRQHSKTKHRA
jgi:glycosyltransferase involved in cell wall biosynthesis